MRTTPAPRRSSRLQRKHDEAFKKEAANGQSASLLKANKTSSTPNNRVKRQSSDNPIKETQSRKRKREGEAPGGYRGRHNSQRPLRGEEQPSKRKRKELEQTRDPVGYWASHSLWPSDFADMPSSRTSTTTEQDGTSSKRKRSGSYSQSYKDGKVPAAHSAPTEERLFENGINLQSVPARELVSHEDLATINDMFGRVHEYTPSTGFPMERLGSVLDRLSVRNEARIVRDLSPLLIPSPENLFFSNPTKYQDIYEDINADWKDLKTMGGPMPKPDLTIGIGRSAFNEDELAKLENYRSWDHTTLFTNYIYFPFLICEVKCSDTAVSRAARQSAHAGGIAANAVFQLLRSVDGDDGAKSLYGQILSFSIAHDHQSIKIYGFFPSVDNAEKRLFFHRYVIEDSPFGNDPDKQSKQLKRVRDFVIELYTSWYPKHLERIRGALRKMPKPTTVRDLGLMGPPTTSASEQALPEQLQQQQTIFKTQIDSLVDQLKAQREQSQTQIDGLIGQLKAQREESEQQRKESERQREESEKRYAADKEEQKKWFEALLSSVVKKPD